MKLLFTRASRLVNAYNRGTNGREYTSFFVQNWWEKQQFVEISLNYAYASSGKAYFIKTQNLTVREGLPWTKQLYDYF